MEVPAPARRRHRDGGGVMDDKRAVFDESEPYPHEGSSADVSPTSAGGTPAPTIPPAQVRATAEYLARMVGCCVVEVPVPPRKYVVVEPSDAGVLPEPRDAELRGRFDEIAELVGVPAQQPEAVRSAVERYLFELDQRRGERDEARAEVERLRAEVDNLSGIRLELRERLTKAFAENTRLDEERDEAREEWKRADAEMTRLRKLVGNENIGCEPDSDWSGIDRAEAIRQAACFRQNLTAVRQQRDAIVQQLGQHLADENSAQAANDRLRDDIQNLNAGHDGTMRYITNRLADILDADTTDIHELLNVTAMRVEGGNAAEGELSRRKPTFRPGQRVRIGLCNGIVLQPKDVTRVQLEGTLYDADYPTRVVNAIPGDDEEVPF